MRACRNKLDFFLKHFIRPHTREFFCRLKDAENNIETNNFQIINNIFNKQHGYRECIKDDTTRPPHDCERARNKIRDRTFRVSVVTII